MGVPAAGTILQPASHPQQHSLPLRPLAAHWSTPRFPQRRRDMLQVQAAMGCHLPAAPTPRPTPPPPRPAVAAAVAVHPHTAAPHHLPRCRLQPAQPSATQRQLTLTSAAAHPAPHCRAPCFSRRPACTAASAPGSSPAAALLLNPDQLTTMAQRLARNLHQHQQQQQQLPDAAWWDGYWAASAAALPAYSPQQLADSLTALGVLGVGPPEAWGERLEQVLQQAGEVGGGPPPLSWTTPRLSQLLVGVVHLGLELDHVVLGTLLQQAAPTMLNCPPGDLTDLVWALAQLGARPGDTWCHAWAACWWKGTAGLTVGVDPSSLAKGAWALASWGHLPEPGFLEAYRGALHAVQAATPQAMTALMWAAGMWQVRPRLLWVQLYYATTAATLPAQPPDGLVHALWAAAAAARLAALEQQLGAEAAAGPAPQPSLDSSNSSSSSLVAGYEPTEEWLQGWYAAVAPHWPQLPPRLVVEVWWGLRGLGLLPDDAWLQPLAAQTQLLLQEGLFDPLELVYLSRTVTPVLTPPRPPGGCRRGGVLASEEAAGSARPVWVQTCIRDIFEALRETRLPAEWRYIDASRPPYCCSAPEDEEGLEEGGV